MRLKSEVATRFFQAPGESFFLSGPRGTGKSTWLRHTLPEALYLDLLRPDLERELTARPERLLDLVRGEPERDTVILDEVQRVPELLNVVHSIIESTDRRRFILPDRVRASSGGAASICWLGGRSCAASTPLWARSFPASISTQPSGLGYCRWWWRPATRTTR